MLTLKNNFTYMAEYDICLANIVQCHVLTKLSKFCKKYYTYQYPFKTFFHLARSTNANPFFYRVV